MNTSLQLKIKPKAKSSRWDNKPFEQPKKFDIFWPFLVIIAFLAGIIWCQAIISLVNIKIK